jgi:hypothetical protein
MFEELIISSTVEKMNSSIPLCEISPPPQQFQGSLVWDLTIKSGYFFKVSGQTTGFPGVMTGIFGTLGLSVTQKKKEREREEEER